MTPPSTLHRRGVDVPTPDGSADAYLVRPAGDAALPGVLLFMDAIGFAPDFPAEVYTAHADDDPSVCRLSRPPGSRRRSTGPA